MWSTILLIMTMSLFVSSSAFKKINFNKPKCNLYYINDIHKHMLQNQKPTNSLVINNMISRFSKQSGQTVEHIKACLTPERTNNNPKQKSK
jgi:hypothetical protein